ncbi:uncharacterized protein BXZ73DRAFT_105410 [Epithele typhae]|uniref:uncharacterized protein n=1 Tax=Epithele typhae TaxID=378194 RepID=UPI0020072296|nr:uncharacterized protein BXZ73DRAFT_105410 [Epithele typhae]KAH9917890.1 hypothetical protein BXZ73DRAFT_105410 [Epithele typhae]
MRPPSASAQTATTAPGPSSDDQKILLCFGGLKIAEVGDEVDAEDEKAEDPSQNILGNLQGIINEDLGFSGEFSFINSWAEQQYPNPLLSIDDFGTVGLPLSTREAVAIKEHAAQAPFGKADKTIVDKTVRDTWEIDGFKVRFRSTTWAPFMDSLVRDVCKTLGVNYIASKPRCELYKLLLYEKGSHFLPHVDTEKVNGMFATIVVVLPSEFSGGEVRVSHGGESKTYEHSADSLSGLTALAWYTDVEHEVKPITSGYRLALSFNLLHTTTTLRPALPTFAEVKPRLEHVLRSWKQEQANGPQKLVCLLEHQYSHAGLNGSGLKGPDAHLIGLLQEIGGPLGFRIGFANLEIEQRGSLTIHGEPADSWEYNRRHRSYYDDDHSDYGSDDVDMGEVCETDVQLTRLVDINGVPIQKEPLRFDPKTETIPADLTKSVVAGAHDEQSWEGYTGNDSGSLERIYRRTLLVVWPSWATCSILGGGNTQHYACTALSHCEGSKPTAAELEMVKMLLKDKQTPSSVKALSFVATKWGRQSLWMRMARACGEIPLVQFEHIRNAIETFGLLPMLPCLESAVSTTPSDVMTFQLLDKLEAWQDKHLPHEKSAKQWFKAQRLKRFYTLHVPGDDDPAPLIRQALAYGGLELLQNTVLPQTKQLGDSRYLLKNAVCMYIEVQIPDDVRIANAKEFLAKAINDVDFYAPMATTTQPPTDTQHYDAATPYINACFDLDREDLLPTAFTKLLKFDELANDTLLRRVQHVLLPLTVYVSEILKRRQNDRARPPEMEEFCEVIIGKYMLAVAGVSAGFQAEDVGRLMEAVAMCGNPDVLLTTVLPGLEQLRLTPAQLQGFILQLRPHATTVDGSVADPVQVLQERLLNKWSSAVEVAAPLPSANTNPYPWLHQRSTTPPKPFLQALDFCLAHKHPDAGAHIVQRLTQPPSSTLTANYVEQTLVPLILGVHALLRKYALPPSAPPYAAFFRAVALHYAQTVLGPCPRDPAPQIAALGRWKCACTHCSTVRQFLTAQNANEGTTRLSRIGNSSCRHVEDSVSAYARDLAVGEIIRSKPQSFQVTKKALLAQHEWWKTKQQEIVKLLALINADSSQLEAILGDDHARITALMRGEPPASGASKTKSTSSAAGSQTPALGAATSASTNGPPAVATMVSGKTSLVRTAPPTRASPPAKRKKAAYDPADVIDLTSD